MGKMNVHRREMGSESVEGISIRRSEMYGEMNVHRREMGLNQ